MFKHVWMIAALLCATACGPSNNTSTPIDGADDGVRPVEGEDAGIPDDDDVGGTADTGGGDDDMGTADRGYPVPPERWPTEQRVTHDVDRDLAAVLEYDKISAACPRWRDGERDEETKLLCGKWMFFYETFGTVGIPTPLLDFAQEWYAGYYGVGFANMGFVADPYSPDGMPLGLAETTGMLGEVETRAFTCASCHFGQMADGRYAVGYGNLSLDYGKFIAGLGAPLSMSLDENSPDVHEDLRTELLPYVRDAKEDPTYQFAVANTGLQLLDAGQGMSGGLGVEDQARFLALNPGTMDFLTEPLVDDGVWTVSRILSLWNIPDAELRAAAEMDHEYLSWTGGATNLESFISGFVAIGVADTGEWTSERIEPLEAYLRSLRTPPLESSLNAEAVERGSQMFVEAGCAECHNGPSGESTQAYPYAELGTDPEMAKIFNPDENDELCCGFGDADPDSYVVTDGIKAPRLTGVENQIRWLHNGSVPSLGSLLCLEPRPTTTEPALTATGHEYGCELDESARRDLIEYLRSL